MPYRMYYSCYFFDFCMIVGAMVLFSYSFQQPFLRLFNVVGSSPFVHLGCHRFFLMVSVFLGGSVFLNLNAIGFESDESFNLGVGGVPVLDLNEDMSNSSDRCMTDPYIVDEDVEVSGAELLRGDCSTVNSSGLELPSGLDLEIANKVLEGQFEALSQSIKEHQCRLAAIGEMVTGKGQQLDYLDLQVRQAQRAVRKANKKLARLNDNVQERTQQLDQLKRQGGIAQLTLLRLRRQISAATDIAGCKTQMLDQLVQSIRQRQDDLRVLSRRVSDADSSASARVNPPNFGVRLRERRDHHRSRSRNR